MTGAPEFRPPRMAQGLVARAVPPGLARDGLLGDLHELYQQRRRRGRLSSDLWYWREAFLAAVRYRTERVPADLERESANGGRTLFFPVGAELRPALRRLYRHPGFTAAAIGPLALGLGATATILSLVHDALLAPLPYPESDRLVVVRHVLPGFQGEGELPEVGAFLGQLLHYEERSRLLSAIGGYWTFDGTVSGEDGAEYLHLGGVSAGLLKALRIVPMHGRLIEADDPFPQGAGAGTTLLSNDFWRERYGSEPTAVGRSIPEQGWPYEIVGVLPPDFALASRRPVLWNAIPDQQARDNPQWTVTALVGRLAPGATIEGLERELATLTAELPERYPDGSNIRNAVERGRMTPRVMPMRDWMVGDADRALWLLLGATVLLLIVALGNVAGLFLVRADAGRRDHAVRMALGSGRRGAIVRVLLESAMVVGAAAGLGLYLAHAAVGMITARLGDEIPRVEAVAVGWQEVLLVLAISALCCFGLAAVQHAHVRHHVAGTLLHSGRGTAGAERLRVRHVFIALQVAFALVLMVGGGLIFRSARGLGRVDPGFRAENLLTFRVVFPTSQMGPGQSVGPATLFYHDLAAAVEAIPGVEAVGWGTCVPLSQVCTAGGFPIKRPEGMDPRGEDPVAGLVRGSPGYRSAVGVPLIAGRDLRPGDEQDASNPALVSESLAQQLWPDRDPLGRTFTPSAFGTLAEPPPFTVVGVVGEVRFGDLRRQSDPIVYAPARNDVSMVSFAVRTPLPPAALLDPIRSAIREIRPDIPLAFAELMETSIARHTASIRFSALIVAFAACATLLLAVLGVYGTLAYAIGLRRHEFGIRVAIGATNAQLRRMILAQGLIPVGLGIMAGLSTAWAASGLVRSLLFGVAADDASTYVISIALLLLFASAAIYVPARRASRVAPAEALRHS